MIHSKLKTSVAIGLGVVLVATLGALAFVSAQRMLEANARVARSQRILNELDHTLSTLRDAESEQRGFLLTGNGQCLEKYRDADAHVRRDVTALMNSTRGEPKLQEDLHKVLTLADAKLAELSKAIELRQKSGLPAALAIACTERGKQIADELQILIAHIRVQEEAQLKRRNDAAQTSGSRTLQLIAIWIPASLILLVLIGLAIAKSTIVSRRDVRTLKPRQRWSLVLLRYGGAVAVALLATGLRLWLMEALDGPLPTFITLYPAVLLTAALGGGGPGLLATIVAVLAADYWYLPPHGFGIESPSDLLATGIFAASGIFFCFLAERLRRVNWIEAHNLAQQEELQLLNMGNLLTLDSEYRIRHWSEGCHRLYGFTSEEALGQLVEELLETRSPGSMSERQRLLLMHGHWQGEVARRHKDGSDVSISILWALRRDEHGQPSAILEVSTDITAQKQAEESLHQQSDELSRQNEELTQQTEELTQQTEELTQQSEELSNQNEELQTQSEEIQSLNVELTQRENLLQFLLDSARLASTEHEVMQDICQAALEMFAPMASAVLVHEKRGPQLHVRAQAGLSGEAAKADCWPVQCSFADLVIQQNRTACLDDLTLRPDLKIWNSEHCEPFQSVLAAPMRTGGEAFGVVAIYSHQPQQWTAVQFRLAEWLAGQCANILETLRLQQRVQQLYEEQQTIFNAVPAMIWYKDTGNNLIRVNRAVALALGKPIEQIEGRSCYELFPNEAQHYYEDDLEVIHSGKPKLGIIETLVTANGERRWVESDKIPYRDPTGNIIGILLFTTDITERKQFEEELQRAKAAAEAANVAKSQFLANMSHELRTPMNTILGMTELALGAELSVRVRDYLQTAKQSADGLLELLNEILDLSRVEAGKFDLEATLFDIHRTVDQVIKTVNLRAEEKGLMLTCDLDGIPPQLVGDPLRLRQILVNLVGNAVKFTSEGEVAVRGRVLSSESPEVVLHFEVADTGIGIAPEDQRRIFAPFTQEDTSTTRLYGGTGLGLTIAAKLVELMGGRIWIESELGKGSVFHFTVRMGLPDMDAADANASRITREAFRGLPILVVADHLTNRRILVETFKRWAMVPDTAQDVPRALEKVHQAIQHGQSYRFVLAEAEAPGCNGFALAEALLAVPTPRPAVILMMSKSERQRFADRCAALGAYCLEKPLSQSGLFDLVVQVLGVEHHASGGVSENRSLLAEDPPRRLRVLLVEDTLSNQKLVAYALNNRGHDVTIAENGQKAVDAVRQHSFDVVLMDVQMPIMDGMAATRAIRAMSQPIASLPIVAMTAHALTGDAERCLEAGMDAYLGKPVRIDELIAVVERFAEKQDSLPQAVAATTIEADEPAVSSGSVFDLATALKHCLNRYELFQDTVECFFQSADRLLSEMREAVAKNDLRRIGETAHRLVGVLVVGAQPVVDAARRVQRLSLAGERTGIDEAVDELLHQIDALKQSLTPHRASDSAD